MGRFCRYFALALVLSTAVVGQVMAIGVEGSWYVTYSGSDVTWVDWKFDGAAQSDAGVARFAGWFRAGSSGPYVSQGRVFCVDLFRTAGSGSSSAYDVKQYTGVDDETGWREPDNDSDEKRAEGGLYRAARLASVFGGSWIDGGIDATDKRDRQIALNVALWQASYGTRFEYVSGMSSNADDYYNNVLLPFYDLGQEANYYTWWDSRGEEDPETSLHQDFLRGEVPEPGSLLLIGSILLGAAAWGWRSRKRA